MKNYIVSIGVFLVTFICVHGQQQGMVWKLNVSGNLMSDFGVLSVFPDYSNPIGIGLNIVRLNSKGGGWFIQFNRTQSHSTIKPRSIDYMEIINPGYEVYSKNHLNYNALMFGFQKYFYQKRNLTGALKIGLGPNLSNFSAINGVSPNTQEFMVLENAAYYFGLKSEISAGFLYRINESLWFSSEVFSAFILQHYIQNTFLDLNFFIGINFGVTASL